MITKKYLLLIPLIILAALSVYSNTFNNSFVYDDYPLIVDNEGVRNLSLKSVTSSFTDRKFTSSLDDLSKDIWRPFATTCFAIDYKLWKLDPRPYHIENVLWHIADAILVYLATLLILESPIAAFITSLVFAMHPVQAESVTWISSRPNMIFLFFFMLSFIFHIKNRKRGYSSLNYVLSVTFFTFSLFCKEMAITLPLVLMLYDFYFYKKESIRSRVTYYLPYFLIGASYVLARFSVLGVIAQRPDWRGGIFISMLMTIKAVAGYIALLIIPLNLKVGYDATVPKMILDPALICSIIALLAIALIFFSRRKNKSILFYILWFFVTLIPVYNIVPFKAVMAERFLYLPMIGFASIFGIMASAAIRLSGEGRRGLNLAYLYLTIAIITAIMVGYACITILRNSDWKDEPTLCSKEVSRHGLSESKFHYLCGTAYERRARSTLLKDEIDSCHSAAIKEFEKSVSTDCDYQIGYLALGNAYNSMGLYGRAIENFKKALAVEENFSLYNNMAISYCQKGMYDKAIRCCKRSLYLLPGLPRVYVNLGNAYYGKHEYARAKRCWVEAVRLGEDVPTLRHKIEDLERSGY